MICFVKLTVHCYLIISELDLISARLQPSITSGPISSALITADWCFVRQIRGRIAIDEPSAFV